MGLTRWILALCGSVRLEVCGAHPERVLNACADAGIACTASEPVDTYTLRITVRARCAETAAELARHERVRSPRRDAQVVLEDEPLVALALDDDDAVFGKTVIDADPPAVEREASGLGEDQHLLAAGRIGIGVDVELAAAAAVLDRQIARDADGSRERRGSAEKGHGIAVKVQLYRSGLPDGSGISRAVVEFLGGNVGAELDIGCAGAQGGAELCIGGNDFRIAFGGAAAGGRGGAPQGGEEAEQHYQCKQ